MGSEDTDVAAHAARILRDAGFGCRILNLVPTKTLRRDRIVVIFALTMLTALAWSYLLWLSADMDMGGMDMSGRMIPSGIGLMVPQPAPWRTMEFAFVFGMWTVMMIGMMTPPAAPMILMYARLGRQGEALGAPLAATVWFAAGYFLVWVAFSTLATLAQWALERTGLLYDGKHEQSPRRARNRGGGRLSVEPPQGSMPCSMPDAVCVPDAPWRISP